MLQCQHRNRRKGDRSQCTHRPRSPTRSTQAIPGAIRHPQSQTLAALLEKYEPTNPVAVRKLYSKLDSTIRRLRAQHEGYSDNQALATPLRGLAPSEKHETTVAVINNKKDVTFDSAVDMIRSHMNSRSLDDGQRPANAEVQP
mmetsp:Transcript_23408/g.39499  ORF Transcript_23408/g.39499 Transcript_23408/m.39499 type:complete len:143 (-) Transcript_23408:3285-3713(-)